MEYPEVRARLKNLGKAVLGGWSRFDADAVLLKAADMYPSKYGMSCTLRGAGLIFVDVCAFGSAV